MVTANKWGPWRDSYLFKPLQELSLRVSLAAGRARNHDASHTSRNRTELVLLGTSATSATSATSTCFALLALSHS